MSEIKKSLSMKIQIVSGLALPNTKQNSKLKTRSVVRKVGQRKVC